jgi:hypothetical protein
MEDGNITEVYSRYLRRSEKLFGPLDVGQVAQHRGKLIQKLAYSEFVEKWNEFKKLETYLCHVMSTGATLNDDIYRKYLELSALVLENPKDFMTL